jgi:hypothetical protein
MDESGKIYVFTAVYQKEGLPIHIGQKTENVCTLLILKEKVLYPLETVVEPITR